MTADLAGKKKPGCGCGSCLLLALALAGVLIFNVWYFWPKIEAKIPSELERWLEQVRGLVEKEMARTGRSPSAALPPATSPGAAAPKVDPPQEKAAPVKPPPPAKTASLAGLLVGAWRGGRHLTEFRADGSFVLDADIVPEPAGGRWRLDGTRLTQIFSEGNQIAQEIVSIGDGRMTTRDPRSGQHFVLQRESVLRVSFDELAPGAAIGGEFATAGLRVRPVRGQLRIHAAEPALRMPHGCKHLLIIDGDRQTELVFEFSPPVRVFTITLPGLTGGSSFPTYQMTGYNLAGQPFDTIGQERHVPKHANPAQLTLSNGLMSRVALAVDNRFGDTVWATFNCLPIAELELLR